MIIDSKYDKSFVSNDLTRLKYDELYEFAVKIRDLKNQISKEICSDLRRYLEMDKFEFLKEMRTKYKEVSSSFDAQLITDVFVAYQNKFEAIQHKLKFENIQYIECEVYRRNTKKHKKGDFKKIKSNRTNTPLSSCLTYLSKYGNEKTIDYVRDRLKEETDEKRIKFYSNVLFHINKFGFVRLFRLATQRRNRVINRYAEKPIEFKSLAFSGRSRKTKIIAYNKKFGSVINSFISLSGFGRKSFDIPVKFNKEYHGKIQDYFKSNPDYSYTICFNDKKKQVVVHLCKNGERYIPEANGEVIGIDINSKHNLFSLSDCTTFDYDRKLVNDFCKLSSEIDKLKSKNKDYKAGKRKQLKLDKLKLKMIKSEQQLISTMCKRLSEQGVGHIVMEDLDNGFGKCYVKDKDNEDINYNRKVKFLGLSSLKQEVEHIARNYDIAVSTVHASYTSKMCPVCGCIEDENRPDQEHFSCVECGYEDNADFNAAKNIRNRVLVTVLRETLLKQLDNGAFEPKKVKREKVKEVLLSFRRNLQKNARSECTESSVTTFDYV